MSDSVDRKPTVAKEPVELPARPVRQVQHLAPVKRTQRNPLRDQ
jgi:hypothetical protein